MSETRASLAALEAASALVHSVFPGTPAYRWPLLEARLGTELWIKHENHTPVGAFKLRGGLVFLNDLARAPNRPRGVITATRGNHGQSIATASRRFGMAATIVVPDGNSPEKNAAMQAQGADLRVFGHDFQAAADHAKELAAAEGLMMLPSFHPLLVQGTGTYALEFFRAAGPLDVVYVPIGLGSGICGMISARDALGMVSAGYGEDDVVIRRHDQVVSAAERCCVRQVVYTSLIGGGDHLGFALAHRWTERRLRASNLSWTILRNGLYAELIAALAKPDNGVIRAPFGDGAVAAVAREDLADAAVAVLSSPASHVGRVYELPGRTAWSMSQFARQIGAEYRPASLKEARRGLSSPPLLPFQPAMLMSIYSAVAGGFLADTAGDLEQLLTGVPRDGLAVACRAAGSARP